MTTKSAAEAADRHNRWCLNQRVDPTTGNYGISNHESFLAGVEFERARIQEEAGKKAETMISIEDGPMERVGRKSIFLSDLTQIIQGEK